MKDDDLKLVDIPKEPLTMKQVIEYISKDTTDLFWLSTHRYEYKTRKKVQLTDVEYDKMLEDSIFKMTMIRISSAVMFEVVKKIDLEDKKVQSGKKQSIMDQYKAMMKEIEDEEKKADDKHSKSGVSPVREGEREEGTEAEALSK